MDKLTAPERAVFQSVALVDSEVDLRRLAPILDLEHRAVSKAADTLAKLGFLRRLTPNSAVLAADVSPSTLPQDLLHAPAALYAALAGQLFGERPSPKASLARAKLWLAAGVRRAALLDFQRAADEALAISDHATACRAASAAIASMETPPHAEAVFRLGRALTIAGRSKTAISQLEHAFLVATGEDTPQIAADALDLLTWLAWIELDGKRTRSYAKRLFKLDLPTASAEAFRVRIRQATIALQLGDAKEALRLLDEAENVSRVADIDSFTSYLMLLGDVHAGLGEADVAIHHVKLAVDIARKRPDRYAFWRRLITCAYVLQSSGELEAARPVLIEALQIASSADLSWEVPFTQTRLALVSYLLGEIPAAADYIKSAFAATCTNRWMYVQRSFVGVLIALANGDEALLATTVDERVLDYAFASADAYTVVPTVAAYHEYFMRVGRQDEAAEILKRGMGRLPSPDCGWLFLASVAKHGDSASIAQIRTILTSFPSRHPIARSYQLLFDAIVAARDGDLAKSEILAGEAQSSFEACEWRIMLPRCAELAGRIGEAKRRYTAMGAHAEAVRVPGVHARPGRPRRGYESSCQRHEIVRLIASGASNRTIADRLGVSSRTVKYRISELYALEGVSSRRELLALLASGTIQT